MPNRIIKESTFTSEKISSLSDFEFRLWVGLITQADDAGRGDARPAIIKGRVFPLRERVTIKDVDVAIHGLAAKGCVSLYTVGGKPYFWFPTWGEHQRIRDYKPKYPGPEEADGLRPAEADCGKTQQMAANGGQSRPPAANSGQPPQYAALIQSEYEYESESEYEEGSAEPQAASAPPVIGLPLNDGTEFPVSVEQLHEWKGLYPAVDVMQQLRSMRGWLDANPKRRKTIRGIKAFVVRWLSKEQDQGGNQKKLRGGGNVFMDIAREEGIL